MKKVILIGGTSYSGSTMLDMMLANDDTSFSCGEIWNMFQPSRTHHVNPTCGCGDPNCSVWSPVKKAGENNFVKFLFDIYPKINTIVISSKRIPWIYEQNRILKSQGFDVVNILIWKSPLYFAHAMQKRGKYKHWERIWLSYHINYFNLVKEFIPVSYETLVTDQNELRRLCEKIKIYYTENRINYWDKKHHTLFGNTTAKYHLYSKQSAIYEDEQKEILLKTNYENSKLDQNYRSLKLSAPPADFEAGLKFENQEKVNLVISYLNKGGDLLGLGLSQIQRKKIILGYKLNKSLRKLGLVELRDVKGKQRIFTGK